MKIKYNNLTRQELYKIAECPYTVNLGNYKSPKQVKQEKQKEYYINKVKEFVKSYPFAIKVMFFLGMLFLWYGFVNNANADSRDAIRESRINACVSAYNYHKDFVDERYIHTSQNIIARCATFMSLVYAYESGWGTSQRCLNHFNCFGIKQPGVTNLGVEYRVADNRFLVFNNFDDGNKAFAMIYFRWYFNQTISQFVHIYSLTDRGTYIAFIQSRYWDLYNELLTLID